MDRSRLGTAVAVAGVVLIVGTLAGSAALAPTIGDRGEGAPETLVGVQGGGAGWHEHGNVHLLVGTETAWREDSADSYFDVTMLENGSVMAGFMHGGYEDCGPYEAPCTRTGFRVIDPRVDSPGPPEVVSEYSFPVRSRTNSEVHDVEKLGDGEYLFTDMDRERLVVVEDGEEVWEWRASELYAEPDDPTRRDWLHINDVDVVPCGEVAGASEGGECYLVSVRNANQLVVVQRGAGAVEVINDDDGGPDEACTGRGELVAGGDGDVRCGDPAVLDHQHNPQWLGEGAVLVADSDNDRVVELHRTDEGDWEPAWTLAAAGGADLNWPRDADRLSNGNTLVTDTLNKRVFEVSENGTVVRSTRTERIPYEADRLPEGEPAEGVRYGSEGTATPEAAGSDVPAASFLLAVLRGAAPWLPFWFAELQLSLTGLGALLVGGGAWLRRT